MAPPAVNADTATPATVPAAPPATAPAATPATAAREALTPATPATAPATGRPRLTRGDHTLLVEGRTYQLEFENTGAGFAQSPYALLASPQGWQWTAITLLASAHTVGAADETFRLDAPVVTEHDDRVTVTVRQGSTAWADRVVTLTCTDETVELSVTVTGTGRLADVVLLGGDAVLPNGAAGQFRSGIDFRSVFVPVPTEPVQFVRPARSSAVLGVVGDADPGRLNGIFSPPPFALGFGRTLADGPTSVPEGEWLGLSVRDAVERLTFTTLRYEPLDGGFSLRFAYEGHTVVDGEWRSPTLVFRPADSALRVLEHHHDDLVAHGFAPAAAPTGADWWHEPIFCGWGAQCARALHSLRGVPDPSAAAAPSQPAEDDTVVRGATGYARQDVYDEFLGVLDGAGLDPGTIVIDDRWQASYGSAETDEEAWPDLRGWIAARHAEGRRVLLWWKAWDPAGIPAEECVTDATGRPLAVDPANPAYLARVTAIVTRLLGPDGLDADGLKVDFTQRAPSGQSLRAHDGVWGVAALHAMLSTLNRAAVAAKPDALVIAHAVHPSFADTCSMVRLNDVLKYDPAGRRVPVADQVRVRHAIARRVLPGHEIDTDQWPMPSRAEWLSYARVQPSLGVPALYYLETIDRSGEPIGPDDLAVIAETWREYRAARAT